MTNLSLLERIRDAAIRADSGVDPTLISASVLWEIVDELEEAETRALVEPCCCCGEEA